jgi:hypothetical protein
LGKKRKHLICHYDRELRGLATNRYGGNQLQHEKALRGLEPSRPPQPVKKYSQKEIEAYERDRLSRDGDCINEPSGQQNDGPMSPSELRFNRLIRASLRGTDRQYARVDTTNIAEWLLTDSPTSLTEWEELRRAIDIKARVGTYGVGVFFKGPGREARHRFLRVSGPFRNLNIRFNQISSLIQVLNDMKRQSTFRPEF